MQNHDTLILGESLLAAGTGSKVGPLRIQFQVTYRHNHHIPPLLLHSFHCISIEGVSGSWRRLQLELLPSPVLSGWRGSVFPFTS